MSTTSPSGHRYRRNPLLLMGWEGDQVVLTECDSLRRFRVDEALVGLLGQLGRWRGAEDLISAGVSVTAEDLEQLHQMGVVERAGPGEEDPRPGRFWSPVELAVHRGQNKGGERDDDRLDGPPPPAFKPRPDGAATVLPRPGPLPPRLDEVLAARSTRRSYGPGPLSLDALSTLLHHSARVKRVVDDDCLGQQVFRPYPAGGARSELELYVVANDVDGLAPGAHWYDGRAHDLVLVRPRDAGQQEVNQAVHLATGGLPRDPQAVVIVTAVFERIMWKYEGIGLGLIDRDVGCLYQTLYLVATALGLAPCAVGGGPEAHNARWLGLDPLVESQVGCFLVGTR